MSFIVPPPAAPILLSDLPRNDVAKAVAYVREKLDQNARVSDDDLHTLMQLQDNPADLVRALEHVDTERKNKGLPGLV